ncbi:sigma-70 family RNA polymerase sigma factor [candidate division KSB1 bacterium]|nr:sigma-70 family RNA polymerase sigma factor [candidate division KSB1 bacterium]
MIDYDSQLMKQCAEGDKSAFTFLVQKYKSLIYQFILGKLKDRETASDLTQDVFIKVFTSVKNYNERGKFKSWIFRIAHNLVIDNYRKQPHAKIFSIHNGNDNESVMQNLTNPAANPEAKAEQFELYNLIDAVVNTLPEHQRTAFVLCQYHGKSYREIADIQECPVGTIKSRIHVAVTKIREKLKEFDLI